MKTDKTACRKTHSMRSDGGLSFAAESDRVLELFKDWANQAPRYNRQRHHRGLAVIDGHEPPPGLVEAQFLNAPKPKRGEVLTDVQLDEQDGIVEDDSSSSSSHE